MITDEEFLNYLLDRQEKLGLPAGLPNSYTLQDLSGNINRVRRVRLDYESGGCYSVIVKHIPEGGHLERYPTVVFPESRLHFEALWIEAFQEHMFDTSVRPARLLDHDSTYRTLILEDLGDLPSFSQILQSDQNPEPLISKVAEFLGTFHANTRHCRSLDNPSAEKNRPFVLTFPVDQPEYIRELWKGRYTDREEQSRLLELIELQGWFLRKHKSSLLTRLTAMGNNFKASPCPVLTHGDLHGDSLLVMPDGSMAVLDAELCDTGTPAFDVGTILAHIWANRSAHGDQRHTLLRLASVFWISYWNALSESSAIPENVLDSLMLESVQYAGAEILRRTLGAATFTFLFSIPDLETLLADAIELLMCPDSFDLKPALNSSPGL